MSWRIFKIIIFTYILALAIWTPPALADTTYTEVTVPTVRDGDFESMGRITVTGTSTQTFTGNNDRAEFRLPPGFYITSTSTVAGSVYDQAAGVVLKAGIGLDNQAAVQINPIAQDPYTPGHYRGFEIIINTKSGGDGNKPEFTLYFDHVYVPRGFSGEVKITVERTETSGFTSGSFRIAQVAAAQLALSVENLPSLTADKKLGPILITENMPGAFDYIELSLPAGFEWDSSTAYIDPGLGLIPDYDGDGTPERGYGVSSLKNKYGRSVLLVKRKGIRSTTTGTLRIECYVIINEGTASYGDVNVSVEGSADPSVTTLKVGSYAEQKVSVTAAQAVQLYGGLKEQNGSDLTITENSPGTLLGGQRTVDLELPAWANWAQEPTVQVEGVTELELGTNNGRAFAEGTSGTIMRFYITTPSRYQAGIITVKEIKVSPAVDASGSLTIKVSGTAGATGEVAVGTVSPPLTATSLSKPALVPGLQEQKAGDIELKEAAGTLLLAHELWVDFPGTVSLVGIPTVKVSAGDLRINMPQFARSDNKKTRLIIPIDTSSTTASTLQITDITYDIPGSAPDGDIFVTVSGPAVNEVNGSEPLMFPNNDVAARVANATVGVPPKIEPVITTPITRNVNFIIGENSYQVNGQTFDMDVAPYILDDRTFLPIRYAGLALGIAPENILWDGTSRTATLFKENLMVQVKVGEFAIYRSGLKITADAAAHIRDDRLMVPLRALATAFGAKVDWEGETRTVRLTL